jgi:hypothetical protein
MPHSTDHDNYDDHPDAAGRADRTGTSYGTIGVNGSGGPIGTDTGSDPASGTRHGTASATPKDTPNGADSDVTLPQPPVPEAPAEQEDGGLPVRERRTTSGPTPSPTALDSANQPKRTPSGLPFRVPQRSLAAPLRDAGKAKSKRLEEADGAADEKHLRSPEEIRRIVGSYQRGTQRGRSDAAKTADPQSNADPQNTVDPKNTVDAAGAPGENGAPAGPSNNIAESSRKSPGSGSVSSAGSDSSDSSHGSDSPDDSESSSGGRRGSGGTRSPWPSSHDQDEPQG